jgi:hypothetical protein
MICVEANNGDHFSALWESTQKIFMRCKHQRGRFFHVVGNNANKAKQNENYNPRCGLPTRKNDLRCQSQRRIFFLGVGNNAEKLQQRRLSFCKQGPHCEPLKEQ